MKTPNILKTRNENQANNNPAAIKVSSEWSITDIWDYPLGKVIIVTGGVLGSLALSGVLLHIFAFVRRGYVSYIYAGKPGNGKSQA